MRRPRAAFGAGAALISSRDVLSSVAVFLHSLSCTALFLSIQDHGLYRRTDRFVRAVHASVPATRSALPLREVRANSLDMLFSCLWLFH